MINGESEKPTEDKARQRSGVIGVLARSSLASKEWWDNVSANVAGTLLAAFILYIGAVALGYVQIHQRQLVLILPLTGLFLIGGFWIYTNNRGWRERLRRQGIFSLHDQLRYEIESYGWLRFILQNVFLILVVAAYVVVAVWWWRRTAP